MATYGSAWRRRVAWATFSILGAGPCLPVAHAGTETDALRVFTDSCGDCHGPDGGQGGIDFITDLVRIVSNGLVVAGKPEQSLIFQRIVSTDPAVRMPLGGGPLNAADVAAIRSWILAGAPTGGSRPDVPPLKALVGDALQDARRLASGERANARYVSLAPWAARPAELAALKNTLSMALNSLSWERELAKPVVVGNSGLLFRIDLEKLGWTPVQWDELTAAYPYGDERLTLDFAALSDLLDTRVAVTRADWLIYTATRPPFYHTLAQIPTQEAELSNRLEIDLKGDFEATTSTSRLVQRAAFVRSGVSNFNRVIERQTSNVGYFWRSYDFSSSSGRRYAIAFPLGPAPAFGEITGTGESLGFTHDGGEIIFRLPNGMQAFMLIEARGGRLNEGPANIVFDRDRGRPITNGISCMGCHIKGLIDKADEARASAEQSTTLSRAAKSRVADLYPLNRDLATQIATDRTDYQTALGRLAVERGIDPKPATYVEDEYQAPVDVNQVVRELDLATAADLAGITGRMSREAAEQIAPLFSGQPVPRDVFATVYEEITRALVRVPVDRETTFARTGLAQALPPDRLTPIPIAFGRSGEVQSLELTLNLDKAAALALSDLVVILRDDQGREARLNLEGRATRDGERLKITVPDTAPDWRALIGSPVQGAWTLVLKPAATSPRALILEAINIRLGYR